MITWISCANGSSPLISSSVFNQGARNQFVSPKMVLHKCIFSYFPCTHPQSWETSWQRNRGQGCSTMPLAFCPSPLCFDWRHGSSWTIWWISGHPQLHCVVHLGNPDPKPHESGGPMRKWTMTYIDHSISCTVLPDQPYPQSRHLPWGWANAHLFQCFAPQEWHTVANNSSECVELLGEAGHACPTSPWWG